jgi:MOSC domain-containing protein YiiM
MELTREELEAALDNVGASPKDEGRLKMIVRRPAVDEREVLEEGKLDLVAGLVGDRWRSTGSDKRGGLDTQLNLMNSRAIALVAGTEDRWPLAGDQLFVDLDLGSENLPAGTRLGVGEAVIQITPVPHTGCGKFRERFGPEAVKLVNSVIGRQLNLRGVCAKVLQPGVIRRDDVVRKLPTRAEG